MKIVIMGSGQSISGYHEYPYRDKGWFVVVVNNAHTFTSDWNLHVRTLHYEYTMKESQVLKEDQEVVNDDIFNNVIKNYGEPLELGQSISLAASYYSLHTYSPSVIGYLGNDFNYVPDEEGKTTFYGLGTDIRTRGISDPDLMAKYYGYTIQDCFHKFEEFAIASKCKCVNFSNDPDSRLPFEQSKPEIYDE